MVRLFFGLPLYLAEKCCENLQSAKGHAQYKSGEGNNIVSIVSIVPFSNNNPPPPRQLLCDKILLKKILPWENVH